MTSTSSSAGSTTNGTNGTNRTNGKPLEGQLGPAAGARPETLGDLGARSAAWASLRSTFVDVRGTQVHVVRGGLAPKDGGDAVPHLFVHGLGGGATNWLEVMGELGEDREVFTMDLPGFGRTAPPRHSAARVRANARFLPAFMDAMGIERAIVHGNSMGGLLTALLGGIAPERIDRAVMVAPALPTAKSDLTHLPGPVFRRFAPFVVPGVGSTLLRTIWSRTDVESLLDEAIGLTVSSRDALSPAMLTIMRENIQFAKRHAWRVESLAYAVESLVAALIGGRELTEGVLAMPGDTLVVWGDADALVGRPVIGQLHQQRPDWDYAVLPGVGHVPMMEAGDRYVAVVRAWLEGRPVTDVAGTLPYPDSATAGLHAVEG
jgi:pimeloyl-ACP methyl ester carboxylesterase